MKKKKKHSACEGQFVHCFCQFGWKPFELLYKTNNLDLVVTNICIYYVLDFNSKAKEGVEIMSCSVCEVSFKHLKIQIEHIKYCGKKFKCTEFDKSFKSKQALVAHLLSSP